MKIGQESSASIRWSGAWKTQSSAGASGGKRRTTTAAGASATVTFSGKAIGLVAVTGPTRGRVRILVDGAVVATVDLGGAAASPVVSYARRWAAAGTHKVKVVCVTTTGRTRIDLDGFVVIQ